LLIKPLKIKFLFFKNNLNVKIEISKQIEKNIISVTGKTSKIAKLKSFQKARKISKSETAVDIK
jgi:hypothetical protein